MQSYYVIYVSNETLFASSKQIFIFREKLPTYLIQNLLTGWLCVYGKFIVAEENIE